MATEETDFIFLKTLKKIQPQIVLRSNSIKCLINNIKSIQSLPECKRE